MPPRAAECLAQAAEALDGGSPQIALDALADLLADAEAPPDTGLLGRALPLAARAYESLGFAGLAQGARAVADDPTDVNRLYALAHALLEKPALAFAKAFAAGLLARAHLLAPEREPILTELVAALEMEGRFSTARTRLAQSALDSFLIRYLKAFTTLMGGELAGFRHLAARLDPGSDAERTMVSGLTEMIARADAVAGATPLDPDDLRGWHYVLTGGLLLHLAPRAAALGGRYGDLEDSEALCLEGIQRLGAVLDAWGMRIPRILMFPNPESRRLGLAVAGLLGVSAREAILPDAEGLFVVYDLENLLPEVRQAFRDRAPGKLLFAHAARWTAEQDLVADFTTLLYERIVSPWNRHAIYPRRPNLPTGPPTESDAQLAARIATAVLPATALEDLPALLALANAAGEGASARRSEGTRSRLWIGRPVRNGRAIAP